MKTSTQSEPQLKKARDKSFSAVATPGFQASRQIVVPFNIYTTEVHCLNTCCLISPVTCKVFCSFPPLPQKKRKEKEKMFAIKRTMKTTTKTM